MRSNIAALFVGALAAGGSFAAPPQGAYDGNRDAILSGDCYKSDGYYFGVGKGVIRTNRSASDNFAKEKAAQDAKSNLICRKAIEGVVWPEAIDKASVATLSKLAAKLVTVQANVGGIVDISLEKTGPSLYTAVVAAPESKLQSVPTASLEEIRRCFLDPHWLKANFKAASRELYGFYLTQKKLPAELVGTEYANWNEEQLDLFCGIPRPIISTNSVPANARQDGKGSGQNLPVKDPGVIGNVNETFEF